MNPINTFGLMRSRRRAVVAPAWADDTIHYEAPESPALEADQPQEQAPEPAVYPMRSSALYRSVVQKHDQAVRNILRQAEQTNT